VAALRLPPATGSMTLSGTTITLASGNWASLGFKANQQIFIEGSQAENSGPRVISSVSGSSLVVQGANFTPETSSALTVSITLTDDERVNLAAAERNDVSYLRAEPVDATVSFDTAAKTITRLSGGSFSTFVAGDYIQVLGKTPNATDGQQRYQIASVSGNGITLVGNLRQSEASVAVNIAPVVLNPVAPGVTVVKVRINLIDDFDITASGAVTVDAEKQVFLGSESTVSINAFEAGDATVGDNARIKVGESILRAAGSNSAIRAGDLVLEAGDGTIGQSGAGKDILINLLGGALQDGVLTARAHDDVYVTETAGNLNIGTVFADLGGAYLKALAGSMVDGLNHGFVKIKANLIVLDAAGAIGENGDVKAGTPTLAKAKVAGTILEQGKADKVRVFKFKKNSQYKIMRGHRQRFTAVKVTEISAE